MLATPIDFTEIKPNEQYMVSPKLDGVRCLVNKSGVFTRSMKPLPNKYISSYLSSWLGGLLMNSETWVDGELIVGDQTDPMCYRKTSSAVMASGWHGLGWSFYMFDIVNETDASWGSHERNSWLHLIKTGSDYIKILHQHLCMGIEVQLTCKKYLDCGYEGAMIKPADAPYKFGRATPKSMELMKYKAWEDDEATVIGYVQKEKNTNEAKANELGNTARSSHKSGMVAVNELGALVVDYKGKHFNIGSGFTEEERIAFWLIRDKLIGEMVKFKYMPYGEYEVPRLPIYLGFRDKKDL